MEREQGTITEERERVEAAVHGEMEKEPRMMAGGSIVEAICGAAAVVLAILGLLGAAPLFLASIAGIAVGLALLIGGGTIAARFSKMLSTTEARFAPTAATESIQGGMAMESLSGLAGAVLSFLALFNVEPFTLLPIASILYGLALLMASGATARLNELMVRGGAERERAQQVARQAASAAAGTEVLIGLAGIVLGILALADFVPLTLMLVAMLAFGASILLSGTAIAGRFMSVFAR